MARYSINDVAEEETPKKGRYSLNDVAEQPAQSKRIPPAVEGLAAVVPGGRIALDVVRLAKFVKEDPERAAKLLPAALATGGALAAGPAILPAAAMAALGGVGGKGLEIGALSAMGKRGPYKDFKSESVKALKETGIEGAKQGAYEVLGGAVAKGAAKVASPLLQRAIGYTKALLNRPDKRQAAKETVQTLMELQGTKKAIVSPFGSSQKMFDDVTKLSKESGEKIGQYLKDQGKGFNPQQAIQKIEELRPRDVDGNLVTGGENAAINSEVDNAIATIESYIKKKKVPVEKVEVGPLGESINLKGEADEIIPMAFEDANKIKGLFQDKLGKAATTPIQKRIAGVFRGFLDDSLEEIGQATQKVKGFQDFMKNKKLYQASERAKQSINNRLSSEEGNKLIGILDVITGAGVAGGALAQGQGVESAIPAAAAIGLRKIGAKYGVQVAATLAAAVARNPQLISIVSRLAGEGAEALMGGNNESGG